MSADGAYSQVADKQLDSLEAGPDTDLYHAVLDACELIFRLPAQAQARSTAIATSEGIRFRLPVAGHPPYKVFWSADGPRIEAVFPTRSRCDSGVKLGDQVAVVRRAGCARRSAGRRARTN